MVTEQTLIRARAGDEDAFRELTDPYRRELQLHCYRIVGSLQDAEDLLQETLVAAWRGLEGFEGRTRCAPGCTHRDEPLPEHAARPRAPPQESPLMAELPEPTRRTDPIWLEPYPDVLLDGVADSSPEPQARYEMREAVGLAFVAALQHLPPRQRAVLVLRDVLGFHGAEVADMLKSSEASVKGALQRARATLDARRAAGGREEAPLPSSARERELVGRFVEAVERGDTDGVVALLTADAWLTMPPQPYEYQGPMAIGEFLHDRARVRGAPLRLVATRANGQPAFGCYLPDPQAAIAHAYGLLVLTLKGDRISAITWFFDRGLFPNFGLPRTLQEPGRPRE